MFFFKQKTAYEMRISDWSSDVCSSDLIATSDESPRGFRVTRKPLVPGVRSHAGRRGGGTHRGRRSRSRRMERFRRRAGLERRHAADAADGGRGREVHRDQPWRQRGFRSEEHTSELQSLMRLSYAVFCLKKKNQLKQQNNVMARMMHSIGPHIVEDTVEENTE